MNKSIKEKIFFIAFNMFLFGILMNSTKYNIIPVAIKTIHVIQIIACLIAISKIALDVKDILKSGNKIKINYFYLAFFILSFIVFIITRSKTLVYLDVFILASKDIDFNKILKHTLRVLCITFVFVVSSYLLGAIQDVTVPRGNIIRHSYGWASPNCFILNIFEIVTLYLYLRKDKLKLYDYAFSFILLYVGYYFTNSRTGLYMGVLLVLLFILVKYTKINKLYNKTKYLQYALPTILTISFLLLTLAYDKYGLYNLDARLSGRLFFTDVAIENYHIKPFGSKIDFIGQVLESEYKTGIHYNYVDCSYIKTLLNYGVFYLIYILIFLIILTRHAIKNKDYYLLSIILVMEIYCFVDSWLLGIEFNPFLLLLVNYIYPLKEIKEEKHKELKKGKILSISVAAYNLSDLIKQCLDSFVSSPMRDYLEVIVTDDGSKDDTREIVKKYEKRYPGIVKLVAQKNSGPGSTVNSGIKHATGKYFRMVDGDDRVFTRNLERLIYFLNENDVDMVLNDYYMLDHKTNKVTELKTLDLVPNKIDKFDNICEDLFLEMHNTIFKTSILKTNKIKLDNSFYTDVEYLLFPLPYVKKCVYLDYPIYIYRINQNTQSVSVPSMQKNIDIHTNVLEHLIDFYKDNHKKLSKSRDKYLIRRIVGFADNELVTLLTFKQTKKQVDKIRDYNKWLEKKNKTIFKYYSKSKKYRLIKLTDYKICDKLSKYFNKKFSK